MGAALATTLGGFGDLARALPGDLGRALAGALAGDLAGALAGDLTRVDIVVP